MVNNLLYRLLKRKFIYILSSLFCVVSCIVLSNCNKEDKTKTFYMDFETVHTNEVFSIVLDVATKGDTLLVNQFSGDHLLNWLSLKNGECLKSEISKGNGPGEMTGSLLINTVNDSLLILDRQAFNLYKSDFNCDSIIPYVKSLPFWTSKVFPLSNGINIVSKIPFGVDDEEVKKFRFAAMVKDSVISHFGNYPDFSNADKKSDLEQKAHFHQVSGFCEIPDNRFVVVSSHVLSLYYFDDGIFKLQKEIKISPYEYSATPATKIMSAMAKIDDGYDVGVCNGITYFNGKLYMPYKKEQGDSLYSILCYDTELNLVGEIIPQSPIMAPFTIDSKGRIIALAEGDSETNICISKKTLDELW